MLDNRLEKIRTRLIIKMPFVAVLLLRLRTEVTSSVKTAAVDGVSLFINPDFAGALSDKELEGLIVHEVMHVALKHHLRIGDRDQQTFNEAADYAVNARVLAAGYTLPEGGLFREDWADRSTESIYNELYREKQQEAGQSGGQSNGDGENQQGEGQSNGDGENQQGEGQSWGEVLPAPTQDPAELAEMESELEIANQQAAKAQEKAEKAGTAAGGSSRALKGINTVPQQDWRAVLREYMTSKSRSALSWSRPNRRFREHYIPSMRSRGAMGHVVIAIDTSGSVNEDLLNVFAGECASILDEIRPEKTTVIACDAIVRERRDFEAGEPLEMTTRGGGGTRFSPVFRSLRGETPDLLIYFTDLFCDDYPDKAPEYPVLWAAYDSRQFVAKRVPFGDVLDLDGSLS